MQSFSLDAPYCPLPLTVPEHLIRRFYWCAQEKLRSGMRFDSDLYGLVAEVGSFRRVQAFDLARQLSEQGKHVVVSVASPAQVQYRVWVNLRDWTEEIDLEAVKFTYLGQPELCHVA